MHPSMATLKMSVSSILESSHHHPNHKMSIRAVFWEIEFEPSCGKVDLGFMSPASLTSTLMSKLLYRI